MVPGEPSLPLLAAGRRCCSVRALRNLEAAASTVLLVGPALAAPAPLTRPLLALVPAGELILAAGLLGPDPVGRLAALGAVILVALLSLTLLRSDMSAGCGCWEAVAEGRSMLIARNLLLAAFAIGSLGFSARPTAAAALAALPGGILIGFVVMEMPRVRTFASESRRTVR